VGGLVGGSLAVYGLSTAVPNIPKAATASSNHLASTGLNTIGIVKAVTPSVVSITSQTVGYNFFGQALKQEGAGTGVILTANGYILTNRHVVPDGVSNVTVYVSGGKQYSGSVIARDPDNDLALLKIPANGLTPATLGNSDGVQVGDSVIAIGNALGQYQNTVTEGIISGIDRNISAGGQADNLTESLKNVFQTDAAINSGNSGGPLVNIAGQVIGINTAVSSSAQNIGFSIPINQVKAFIPANIWQKSS
jgi:S1-C subfamily serine protease